MMRRLTIRAIAVIAFIGCVPATLAVADAPSELATVTVDAANGLGPLNNPAWFHNQADHTELLGAGDLALVEQLPVRATRVWIKPDKYASYNSSTGNISYTFNYDAATEGAAGGAYNYLTQAALYADVLLLNIDVCPAELMGPDMRSVCAEILRAGLEHYKARFPTIKYIEVFNEPDKAWVPDGYERPGTSLDRYYSLYSEIYAITNDINAASPTIPLKLGGPSTAHLNGVDNTVTSGTKPPYIPGFLQRFAADTNPAKRLDFVSWHAYGHRSTPANAQGEQGTFKGMLQAAGLSVNIPGYVTEYGVFPGDQGTYCPAKPTICTADYLTQAAAMATLGYYYARSGVAMPMQWVFDHPQWERKSMFVNAADGVPYPYYNLLAMQSMLKANRVGTVSNRLSPEGIGVHALGTQDASGIAVLTTNYQWTTGSDYYDVSLIVKNLGAAFAGRSIRVERYLVDEFHSNYATDPATANLQKLDDYVVGPSGEVTVGFRSRPNGMSLVVLSPVG